MLFSNTLRTKGIQVSRSLHPGRNASLLLLRGRHRLPQPRAQLHRWPRPAHSPSKHRLNLCSGRLHQHGTKVTTGRNQGYSLFLGRSALRSRSSARPGPKAGWSSAPGTRWWRRRRRRSPRRQRACWPDPTSLRLPLGSGSHPPTGTVTQRERGSVKQRREGGNEGGKEEGIPPESCAPPRHHHQHHSHQTGRTGAATTPWKTWAAFRELRATGDLLCRAHMSVSDMMCCWMLKMKMEKPDCGT